MRFQILTRKFLLFPFLALAFSACTSDYYTKPICNAANAADASPYVGHFTQISLGGLTINGNVDVAKSGPSELSISMTVNNKTSQYKLEVCTVSGDQYLEEHPEGGSGYLLNRVHLNSSGGWTISMMNLKPGIETSGIPVTQIDSSNRLADNSKLSSEDWVSELVPGSDSAVIR